MIKKMLLITLFSSVGLMAMMEPATKKARIKLDDGASDKMVTLAIESDFFKIPLHLADLSQTIVSLREDVKKDEVIPVPNVTSATWALIQDRLELAYQVSENTSPDTQKALIDSLENLSADELIDLLQAVNYLDIRILLDSAVQVARQSNLLEVSWEKIKLVPKVIRNDLILRAAVRQYGPLKGREIAVCRGHESAVTSVCVTPDGKKIISGSWDRTVRVWDKKGNELAVCEHGSPVNSVCVTPDGNIVS